MVRNKWCQVKGNEMWLVVGWLDIKVVISILTRYGRTVTVQ